MMNFPKSSKSKVMEKMKAKKTAESEEPAKFEIPPQDKANNRVSFRVQLEKKIVNGSPVVAAKIENEWYPTIANEGKNPKQQPPAEEYHDMTKFWEMVAGRLAEAAKQLG